MIGRRNIIIGAACVAAAGAAHQLHPRKQLILLREGKMQDIIPIQFGEWSAKDADGLVQPKTGDELAATLYSEMVGRIYHDSKMGVQIMMLAAYGDTQSDLLQLHRPESCYAAVGFEIVESKPIKIRVNSATLPARQVVARTMGRQENIIYWTRVGEQLPDSADGQRKVRFEFAVAGYIPDGALIRFSILGEDADLAFATMERFIQELLGAVKPAGRPALIGSALAKQVAV